MAWKTCQITMCDVGRVGATSSVLLHCWFCLSVCSCLQVLQYTAFHLSCLESSIALCYMNTFVFCSGFLRLQPQCCMPLLVICMYFTSNCKQHIHVWCMTMLYFLTFNDLGHDGMLCSIFVIAIAYAIHVIVHSNLFELILHLGPTHQQMPKATSHQQNALLLRLRETCELSI